MAQGNKELKEALVGILVLATELSVVAKDGLQLSDAKALAEKLQEPLISAKIKAAYDGINQVQAEAKDLDMSEVFDLVLAIVPELKLLIEALKK